VRHGATVPSHADHPDVDPLNSDARRDNTGPSGTVREGVKSLPRSQCKIGLLERNKSMTSVDGFFGRNNVFTAPDGQPLHPDYLTRRFRRLVTLSGLPPVRLHDLRHGVASLALAAGTDLKVVQAMLGHASIVLTADTYTSVLPELLAASAEATARLVLATAARNPARRSPQRLPAMQKSAAATPGRLPKAKRPKRSRRRRGQLRRGPHAFHVRPTKIQAI
jgi:hypothetical protein